MWKRLTDKYEMYARQLQDLQSADYNTDRIVKAAKQELTYFGGLVISKQDEFSAIESYGRMQAFMTIIKMLID